MSNIELPASAADSHAFNYDGGSAMRAYMLVYAFAALSGAALWGGVGNVLLPLHVQQIDEAGKGVNLATIKAIAVMVTMVMQPLVGIASDHTRSRWGRRAPWLVVGAAATAIGLLAMKSAGGVIQLLAGWVVAQAGVTMVMGPLAATVADRMPASRRGLMSGIAGVGVLIGFTLGMAIASALFARFGLGTYLIFAAVLLVCAGVFVLVARDRPSSSMPPSSLGLGAHLMSCTHALRDWDFRWVWLARALVMFAYATAATYTVYMLQSYIEPGQTPAQAAKTVALLHLAALPGTLLAMVVTGRWSDKVMRRKPFVIVASFVLAASMAVPFLWPTLTALYVQFVVGGVAFGVFLAVDQALLIDVLPEKGAAGRDLGMGQFAANLGSVMGPVLAGGVLAATAGYRMVWLAALLLAVVSAFALMPVRKAA